LLGTNQNSIFATSFREKPEKS